MKKYSFVYIIFLLCTLISCKKYLDIVPDNVGSSLMLDVTDGDLTEYFKKTKYQLRISVTSDQAVTEDYGVNAHGLFFVDAKVAGQ